MTGRPGFRLAATSRSPRGALRVDATAVCWGSSSGTRVRPGRYTQISFGLSAPWAPTTGGRDVKWGFNDEGPPLAGRFTQISAGLFDPCGLTPDGSVICRDEVLPHGDS
jgi:hypothetical protein